MHIVHVQFEMHLVLPPVIIQQTELVLIWCDMLKNFKGPLRIKGRVSNSFNICSNKSQQRTFHLYHFQALLIRWDTTFKVRYWGAVTCCFQTKSPKELDKNSCGWIAGITSMCRMQWIRSSKTSSCSILVLLLLPNTISIIEGKSLIYEAYNLFQEMYVHLVNFSATSLCLIASANVFLHISAQLSLSSQSGGCVIEWWRHVVFFLR